MSPRLERAEAARDPVTASQRTHPLDVPSDRAL